MVTFQKTNELQPITNAVGQHCCSAAIFVFDVGYVIGKSFEQQMRSANATCAESFSPMWQQTQRSPSYAPRSLASLLGRGRPHKTRSPLD
jgi:hypothetical protein